LEKQGLDRLGALAIVTNAVLYGVAKAEIDLAGKPSVYSRTAIDRAVDFFLSSLKDHGISLRPAYSALEAVQGYMRTLTAAGLLEPSQFNVGGSGSEIEVETWDCPYGQACKALMSEGYEDFACTRGATLAAAILESYGRHSRYQVKPAPDDVCRVSIRVY
jgi:hypothetical protein